MQAALRAAFQKVGGKGGAKGGAKGAPAADSDDDDSDVDEAPGRPGAFGLAAGDADVDYEEDVEVRQACVKQYEPYFSAYCKYRIVCESSYWECLCLWRTWR